MAKRLRHAAAFEHPSARAASVVSERFEQRRAEQAEEASQVLRAASEPFWDTLRGHLEALRDGALDRPADKQTGGELHEARAYKVVLDFMRAQLEMAKGVTRGEG